VSPAKVLEHANDLLVAEMPEKMFVTCLYLVLDPATGRVVYANAGHNLPYVRTAEGVIEFRATGMPLGLMPGMVYEEREAVIGPGDNVLLYSDGLVEAHDPSGAMYGFPRLRADLATELAGSELLDELLDRLHAFTGRGWEQEDDITLVALRRSAVAGMPTGPDHLDDERTLLEFEVPGAPGNERVAMDRVAEAVGPLGLQPARLARLKTAVSEATMNAIEYGSGSDPDVPIGIAVASANGEIRVRITDRALGGPIPGDDAEQPDLEAKLAGLQKARGWGLFLIRNMVDRVDVIPGDGSQTVTLTLALEGDDDERDSA
jgi:anti-sigma regulatory factor (Ser/Thr protein kinase)